MRGGARYDIIPARFATRGYTWTTTTAGEARGERRGHTRESRKTLHARRRRAKFTRLLISYFRVGEYLISRWLYSARGGSLSLAIIASSSSSSSCTSQPTRVRGWIFGEPRTTTTIRRARPTSNESIHDAFTPGIGSITPRSVGSLRMYASVTTNREVHANVDIQSRRLAHGRVRRHTRCAVAFAL